MPKEESDTDNDVNKNENTHIATKVYKRRWWVLAVFCLASIAHCSVWNTWGPIAASAKVVFGWSDGTVGMLPNWGNIAFIIAVLPMCWLIDEKGLRMGMLVSSVAILIATALRCITIEPTPATWLMNIGAILNGIGGPVPFAGPPLIAATWFPPNQRATATGISTFFNYFGIAIAFVIGPQIVSQPVLGEVSLRQSNTSLSNITHHVNYSSEHALVSNSSEKESIDSAGNVTFIVSEDVLNINQLKNEIQRLMYIECGFAGLVVLCILLYFPNKPPMPPSKTAAIQRTEYKKGILKLVRNGPVWLLALAYSIPTGVLGVWSSVLALNLGPVGISQVSAGWLGFYGELAGCAAGLLTAKFSDIFMRKMKIFLVVLFTCSCVVLVWFTVLCNKYISFNHASMFASGIMSYIFINATIPLFYEITCETSYPVAEGVTAGFLTLLNNFSGIFFLLVLLIPGIGTSWMNWCLLGCVMFALPLLVFFPEKYRRTDIDLELTIPENEEQKMVVNGTEPGVKSKDANSTEMTPIDQKVSDGEL